MSLMSGTIKFWIWGLFVTALNGLCFAEIFIKIWLLIPEMQKILPVENKVQKEFHLIWMYLKINIPDIRLIPLDHLTYYVMLILTYFQRIKIIGNHKLGVTNFHQILLDDNIFVTCSGVTGNKSLGRCFYYCMTNVGTTLCIQPNTTATQHCVHEWLLL